MNAKPVEKPLTMLQRLETAERRLQTNEEALEGVFNQVRASFQSQLEIIEGVMEVLKSTSPEFEKTLQEKIDAKRHERTLARSAQEKAQLEQLVTSGVLVASDTIKTSSILVGRIFNSDGTINGSGRVQIEFNRLTQAAQAAMLDKEVGFVYEADSKERMEVLEIYEAAPPAPEIPTPSAAVVDSLPVGPSLATLMAETVTEAVKE